MNEESKHEIPVSPTVLPIDPSEKENYVEPQAIMKSQTSKKKKEIKEKGKYYNIRNEKKRNSTC